MARDRVPAGIVPSWRRCLRPASLVSICDNTRPASHAASATWPDSTRPRFKPTSSTSATTAAASPRRADGKTVFVSGALAGRTGHGEADRALAHFDEARRSKCCRLRRTGSTPRCPHFGTCGGCALQHLAEDKQILAKQRVLLENLERIGHVAPQTVLPPLTDAAWGYRRKGRFSVRRVEKKDKTLVGFRERDPRFVADLRDLPHRDPADRRAHRGAGDAGRWPGGAQRHPADRIHRRRCTPDRAGVPPPAAACPKAIAPR